LQAEALALAGWLQGEGVEPGDRVALYLQNCPQFIIACYAILRANAVLVPINPMHKVQELSYQLGDAQARVLICAADL
ncbi:AMP-binding protein, partial [Pseudomonas sp. SIMBA_077]